MKIIIDTREQEPFSFKGKTYTDVQVTRGCLPTGDYSLAGLTDRVAIERKSLADLVACLGRERERFERELIRGQGLECFVVVVEANWQELELGQYRSLLNPHAACQSVAAFTARYKIPFLFAGTHKGAEYLTWSLLKQYLDGASRRLRAIVKAHEAA